MPRKRTPNRINRQSNVGGKPVSVNAERYARRNAKARSLGYRNYYDYRIHNHGKIPAGESAPTGEVKQRLRGHRGRVDFLRSLGDGDLISLVSHISTIERTPDGRYRRIDKLVLYTDGDQRTFTLRNLTRAQLIETIAEEERRGAVFSPAPSLDQRRLVNQSEHEGGY
jgi:hypothetical protein